MNGAEWGLWRAVHDTIAATRLEYMRRVNSMYSTQAERDELAELLGIGRWPGFGMTVSEYGWPFPAPWPAAEPGLKALPVPA